MSKKPPANPPNTTLNITFQLPTPVAININAPIKHIKVDVSPIEPGIKPKNILENE
ncbi:hypothetical protein C900_02253 [Fulvivirga imtechensis AK7]|uniref:Uncharacterized protein n=1 Tax=Fulvivirga imtechensis AK7 TaxID=1237149 RepID=L8JUG0_9BACT|nr:hypothetical protein C900_02253 [Fulvivirga imtechensis AK7]